MKTSHSTEQIPSIPGARVVVLQSKWHREYTDKMIQYFISTIKPSGALAPEVISVPGSLELPIAAKTVAMRSEKRPEAVVCFGAIIKGDTFHFEWVMNECARGLTLVSLEHDIPIITEVVPCTLLEHLIKRSSDDEFNKGIEAAIGTAEIVAFRRREGKR